MDYGIPAPPGGFPSPAPVTRHRPEFTGKAGEYFGIWFVNLILTIVTLGIYSAWAKVRTERYFYGHTRLAGASFEYLASPIAILRGRLIAYAVVIALGLSFRFAPMLYVALFAAISLAMPMIIVLGLRFHARNSAWRGIRFRFDESLDAAYGPFMGWPILQTVTLSLLFPMAKRRQHEFVVEGHKLGNVRFRFDAPGEDYYKYYGIAIGLGVAWLVAASLMVGAVVSAFGVGKPGAPGAEVLAGVAMFYLGFFALIVYVRTKYKNLFWNNARLDLHRFESTLRARDMLWIYVSNGVAILCSVGLLVPWAMVRLARYRAEHFTLLARDALDGFEARNEGQRSAVGEELVSALDAGLDLGF
ncbi:DUF898 domain-containing protein [Lysobacter sp. KIS68-7]|uniref:YjgN family protein n=1 Tax=Lysobacter sp. KIS68-7 TaxID=2904252 RepID=UPI001E3DD3D3|nr:YjgN family protein [Lysobacter sp. KIS68-7]UHQ18602.1 DUF898 domain-containing protein [Lysobacter sp. KIS68-7]